MTNCINCGAVLTSNKCEYCGTIYETDDKNNVNLQGNTINDYTVELVIEGQKCLFYVSEIDIINGEFDAYRDSNGNIYKQQPRKRRKLTLIQY